MPIKFPYQFDSRGRTAQSGHEDHIRPLIEQVLSTAPGERVNRPDFGSGLMQLVFAPLSDELATTTQFMVRGALEQWLGDLIRVEELDVSHEESRLKVIVSYVVLGTEERRVDQFTREVTA
jgi:phage baseplate assembly protein W